MNTSNNNSPELPAPAPSVSKWQRTLFILKAIEVRLRFIAVFVGIGLLMAYWTTIEAYWDRWTRPAVNAAASDAGSEYYCPMHPSVVRPSLEPNGAVPSCPICGMPLSKRKKGEVPALPEGVLTRVQLSPERVQLAGVKTIAANYMPLTKEVRTVGYVQYDESSLAEIVTRVGGYLETLLVDKTFVNVDKGQPLAEIYSPDLYSGVQELLLAKRHNSNDLLESATRRLELLGVDEAEIAEILKGDNAQARLLIRSPLAGQIIEKNVVQGASVEPGTVLFRIADLSTVWIEADVFERDISFLHVGQEIEATVDALAGKKFAGQISVIYPEVNPETRTNRVRVSVNNSELLLRPGMFTTVVVRTPMSSTEPYKTQIAKARQKPGPSDDKALIAFQKVCPVTGKPLGSMGDPLKVSLNEQAVFICCAGCETPLRDNTAKYFAMLAPPPEDAVLSVPEQAVIDTGTQKVVYVEREPGLFEGVEIELGPRTGGFYPVLSGLHAGDRVAAAGAFLLDAETRLNPAAASAYFGASGQSQDAGEPSSNSAGQRQESGKKKAGELSEADLKEIAKLPPADQELARTQRVCPVTDEPLGSMGAPIKVVVDGEPIFLCCQGCERDVRENAGEMVKKVRKLREESGSGSSPANAPSSGPTHQH